MKTTTRRTVPFRRKREGKTNYKKRLELLKGRQNRVVVRRTNKHIVIQLVEYKPDGDHVIYGVTSKRLESMGWEHSGKNLPAAYLTGLLLGKESAKKGVKHAILDLGLQTPKKGSKLYAALKGVIDGGLDVPSNEEVFPKEDRLSGKHISENVEKSFNKIKTSITGASS